MSKYRDERSLIIIGAGASGLMSAIFASAGFDQVKILESDIKPARKLLRTGNGRCNLSNSAITSASPARLPDNYPKWHGESLVSEVLHSFGCSEIRRLFYNLALMTFEDSQGHIYPITNKARSVVDVLLNACEAKGVEIICDCVVKNLRQMNDGRWICISEDGRSFNADKVVVACSHPDFLDELNIRILPKYEILGPLETEEKIVRQLDGIRWRVKLTILDSKQSSFSDSRKTKREEITSDNANFAINKYEMNNIKYSSEGELLFRKYGISGIVVFDASRVSKIGDMALIDMFPNMTEDELFNELNIRLNRALAIGYQTDLLVLLDGILLREITRAILDKLGISESKTPSKKDLRRLAHQLKNLKLTIASNAKADNSQVLRGGIDIDELDPKTLALKKYKNLYACGEVIDVDGPCGGFNLHWAWISGALAGASCADKSLIEDYSNYFN